MIMFERVKNFFATKYRILPVYADGRDKCGFTVQRKVWFGAWNNATIHKLKKITIENELVVDEDAFFKTEDEARKFIHYKKTEL